VSLTHWPGLGSGTLVVSTGSQAEVELACSLKRPANAWSTSSSRNAHMAEPISPVVDVANTP